MFNKKIIFGILLSVGGINIYAMNMNLLRPYDTLIRPDFRLDRTYNFTFFAEHGFNAQGYDGRSFRTNVLQIWQPEQDSLKMLEGFDAQSPIGQLLTNLRADGANDDGVRGHFRVCGDLNFDEVALSGRYQFMRTWFITAYLPIVTMQLKNVNWENLTQNVSSGDFSVKQKLTNNFFQNVFVLGDGLELGNWRRTGVGDLALILEWVDDFYQYKPMLKKVRVNWRLGMLVPTGVRQDEDKIFALPFGNDGSVGLVFGFGLDLFLGNYFKVGGDVQLTQNFGNTRCRRIKTQRDQTELLLLAKTPAYKDFGLFQRFNLYCQFYNIKGLGLKVGYQFAKYGDDVLSINSLNFSDNIANTAESLQERTMQHIIFKAEYDISYHMAQDARVKPSVALWSRIPVLGKRVALSPTVGGYFALDF